MTVQCRRGQITGNTCYINGCRQPACVRAHNVYSARYRRTKPLLVPVEDVQARINEYRAAGFTLEQLAEITGLGTATLVSISRGYRKRVQQSTARLIDNADPCKAKPTRVDATGSRRRLQALTVAGWSVNALSPYCGITRKHLGQIRSGHITTVRAKDARRIAATYDRLWNQPPPPARSAVTQTRLFARERGYAPALAWDDETINDPQARPQHRVAPKRRQLDPVAVEQRKPTTPAERQAIIEELTDDGLSAEQIALMIDAATRTVTRARAITRQREAA